MRRRRAPALQAYGRIARGRRHQSGKRGGIPNGRRITRDRHFLVFQAGRVDWERLAVLVQAIGKDRLVLDLSCRRRGEDYLVSPTAGRSLPT